MKELLFYMIKCQDAVAENLGKIPPNLRPDFTHEFFSICDGFIEKALAKTENADYRKHIIKERLVMEIANIKKFKSSAFKNLDESYDRMLGDCNLVWHEWASKGGRDACLSTIKMLKELAMPPLPVPAEYDGHKVVHQITWKEKYDYESARIAEDKEAFGGYAIVAKDGRWSGMSLGYYVSNTKKYFCRTPALSIDKIQQDEKYHFYKIGKVTLDAGGLFYVHDSWHIQWFTDHLYVPGGDNDYIAYISLKAVGPAYVKDSKEKTSAIWSNRVILVK